jgi:3-hydroxy-3-methylglutaryl CoA synthase
MSNLRDETKNSGPVGIVGYGGYLPRMRMERSAITQANAWFAPQLAGKKGTRAFANWDEDAITMAVAAARDCLGAGEDRSRVKGVTLASSTLPFVERMNSGIVAEALTLDDELETLDLTGSQRAALAGLSQALAKASSSSGAGGDILVLAADDRQTCPASAAELDVGDGAAAILVGRGPGVLAELLGSGTVSVDFVDHFRVAGEDIDYVWEERWIRDEGISKLVPQAIKRALATAGVSAEQIDTFVFPTTLAKMDQQLAKTCGIRPDALVDGLTSGIGDTGVAHPLLLLAHALEKARPGQHILVAQFGSGAQALVFRVTDAIGKFRPKVGVSGYIARGVAETNYTKFLSFKGQLGLEKGMRGEQDKKTALTTLYRHRKAILGLVAGKDEATGTVHFPPSRLSITGNAPGAQPAGTPVQDSQKPHKLAERGARVLSWSAEYLSYHPSPPNHYGQVDFEGGGRILMEFTDITRGEVDVGTPMEMVFRIKDKDEKRGFTRYFWKATPVRATATDKKES